jgi:hypothetical protein
MYHLLQQSVTVHFVFMDFIWLSAIIFLNNINQLIFVMVKCCVFFEVRTEFLNRSIFSSKSYIFLLS